ncbi:MAG: hypothetical protein EAZ85_10785 [Bacteroidetes bacterium]|nr:MAG: hypothetical protein EAZ85_10785 [Bacteroidota bacterium]TAG86069.1 MAG: hypothetical protein EAZ20_13570 [Bacteroidota bacterium]
MKNIFIGIISIFCSLFLSGCYINNESTDQEARDLNNQQIQNYIRANNLNAQGTGSGLFYVKTLSNPTGVVPKTGDSLQIHFTARLLSGKIVDSTSVYYDKPDGIVLGIGTVLAGLDEGIRLMRTGERMTFLIPSYLAIGGRASTYIPPYSVLIYDLRLISVKTEEQQITEFIARKGLTITSTNSDKLRYIKSMPGSVGANIYDGNITNVNYKGTLLNDFVFDSKSDSTFFFIAGQNQVIKGWEQGIKLTTEGEKFYLIIPSSLAYGASGSSGRIPPYAPLFFEMTHIKSQRRRIIEYVATQTWNDTTRTNSGLYTRKIAVNPSGRMPTLSSSIRFSYVVTLFNGTVVKTGTNIGTTLNSGSDILTQGLREGIQLMRQGERWVFLMPSFLAYGNNTSGAIPGKTPVVVEVDLLEVN